MKRPVDHLNLLVRIPELMGHVRGYVSRHRQSELKEVPRFLVLPSKSFEFINRLRELKAFAYVQHRKAITVLAATDARSYKRGRPSC